MNHAAFGSTVGVAVGNDAAVGNAVENDAAHEFDFQAHADRAVNEYLKVQAFYQDLSESIRRIIEESLRRHDINVHSIQARAKDPRSLGKKASRPDEQDPTIPKYNDPLKGITDLAAVRIIAYFPSTLDQLNDIIRGEFDVIEWSDKGKILIEEERFGYQSIHYLVSLKKNRFQLPEYERFRDSVTEIQIRTILQHAWAEIEHDIQYKGATVIPLEIRRRFSALAGLLEIADREFQAIQKADAKLRATALTNVDEGRLEGVEITPDSIKAYLDRRLGPDGRISSWSYDWITRLLHRLGFRTLDQVDTAIRPYDDDQLSRIVSIVRQGQTTRFEYMLLAALGEEFIKRHTFADLEWFGSRQRQILEQLRSAGVQVATYDPLTLHLTSAPSNDALDQEATE